MLGAYLDLIKPKVTFAALATAALGFWIADGTMDQARPFIFSLLGTLGVGIGCSAFNQILERDVDAKMNRTKDRPLPSGHMKASRALGLGIGSALAGIACLFFFVHGLAAFLGGVTLLSYVFLYTPLKRVTPLNTFVGAFPGAMPALIGWSTATRHLGLEAGVLFLVLFLWQLPHFFSIAWIYRQDYSQSGLKMMTVEDATGRSAARRILLYSVLFFLATLLPYLLGMTGAAYLFVAVSLGLCLLMFALVLSAQGIRLARPFMRFCLYDIFALMIMMGVDRR